MRSGTGKIFAALMLGTLALSACSPRKAENVHYDLTTASNEQFLADNAAKKGVVKLPSGLQYRIIHSGNGRTLRGPNDVVTVTYKGWLINGKVFDQTPDGQTATFPSGGLIPGWVQALPLMREGDEWELVLPSDLGYGPEGAGDAIPPDQTLVFDMKLIKVKSDD